MLGHARLSSTEVYTHVAIRKLIDIHSKTHPGATLARKPRPTEPEPTRDREALLASLEEDADDEA
jgi:integrase/recombinase XerD